MQAPLKQIIRKKKIMYKLGGFSDYIWNPTGNILFALHPRPSSCTFLSSASLYSQNPTRFLEA